MNKFLVLLSAFAVCGIACARNVDQSPFSSVDFDHYWTLDDVSAGEAEG